MCGIGLELLVRNVSSSHARRKRRLRTLEALRRRGPDAVAEHYITFGPFELWMAGAVLSLRGQNITPQPLIDAAGNVLLWNGEIFGGGVEVLPGTSDTTKLIAALAAAPSVPSLMRDLQGPWAFAYWHAASRTLWYGRDALGRRSLLRDASSGDGSVLEKAASGSHEQLTLRLSSVAVESADGTTTTAWDDLPANGLCSVHLIDGDGGRLEHCWHPTSPLPPPVPLPPVLARLPAASAAQSDVPHTPPLQAFWEAAVRDGQAASVRLLHALSEAVRRRVSDIPCPPPRVGTDAPSSPSTPSTNGSPFAVPPLPPLPPPRAVTAARVAVLFSGGIDCMVLARLADLHLPPDQPLDLINVGFGALASEAPDRLTGHAGVAELRRLSPRVFNFIEIDISLVELQHARTHLLRVLAPAATVMDVNIGASFWFGSRGRGTLRRQPEANGSSATITTPIAPASAAAAAVRYQGAAGIASPAFATTRRAGPSVRVRARLTISGAAGGGVELRVRPAWGRDDGGGCGGAADEPAEARSINRDDDANDDGWRSDVRSGARVLLVGSGADEQLGGYGRHQTVFRKEGWAGLASELAAERERLWLRNLGRDDRVISDWSREARHPYLDENVMAALAATPLHLICDLRHPLGMGDKLILRRLARMLGLSAASCLQKRAIQFGTRIANKNVCGQALIDESVDLREVVHPDAERWTTPSRGGTRTKSAGVANGQRRGDSSLPQSLSKKRGEWASARASQPPSTMPPPSPPPSPTPPPANRTRGSFVRISSQPLAYAWVGFASCEECDALVARGEAARGFTVRAGAQLTYGVEGFRRVVQMNGKVYAEVATREEDPEDDLGCVARKLVDRFNEVTCAFLGHSTNEHAAQWQNVVNHTPRIPDTYPGLLSGLHVDTYNHSSARFATSLLYLRSPPRGGGGETLFAADVDAGATLLEHGAESTFDNAADRLHSSVTALEASTRALVEPDAGTLLLFFVRDSTGAVDPAAFHGSARPVGGDKWTLQTFWAAPPGAAIEAYARERHAGRVKE